MWRRRLFDAGGEGEDGGRSLARCGGGTDEAGKFEHLSVDTKSRFGETPPPQWIPSKKHALKR
jgi:hypothetical protein